MQKGFDPRTPHILLCRRHLRRFSSRQSVVWAGPGHLRGVVLYWIAWLVKKHGYSRYCDCWQACMLGCRQDSLPQTEEVSLRARTNVLAALAQTAINPITPPLTALFAHPAPFSLSRPTTLLVGGSYPPHLPLMQGIKVRSKGVEFVAIFRAGL